MKLYHLPASRIGVGDVIVLTLPDVLPISVEVWNLLKDERGAIRFYVRESTTWQVTIHQDDVVAVFR
jgi:hypothetical protein